MYKQIICQKHSSVKAKFSQKLIYNQQSLFYLLINDKDWKMVDREHEEILSTEEIDQIKILNVVWLHHNVYCIEGEQLIEKKVKKRLYVVQQIENSIKLKLTRQIQYEKYSKYTIQEFSTIDFNHYNNSIVYLAQSFYQGALYIIKWEFFENQVKSSSTKLNKNMSHFHTIPNANKILTYKNIIMTQELTFHIQQMYENLQEQGHIEKKTISTTFQALKLNAGQGTAVLSLYAGISNQITYWILCSLHEYWVVSYNIVENKGFCERFEKPSSTIILKAFVSKFGLFIICEDSSKTQVILHSSFEQNKFLKMNEITFPQMNYNDLFIHKELNRISLLGVDYSEKEREIKIVEMEMIGKPILYTKLLDSLEIMDSHQLDRLSEEVCSLLG